MLKAENRCLYYYVCSDGTSAGSRYLLRTICRSPALAAVPNSPTQLLQAQLDKLAMNAIINPLTSLMDTRNGTILYNFALTRAMRLLLGEISASFEKQVKKSTK